MASTAVSIEAYAVMTTIFIQGLPESTTGIRSRPLAVPRRRSTNAMWKVRRDASAAASWKLLTAVTWWPSASRQMARVFRILLSSSTTRTLMGASVGIGVVIVPSLTIPGPLSTDGIYWEEYGRHRPRFQLTIRKPPIRGGEVSGGEVTNDYKMKRV